MQNGIFTLDWKSAVDAVLTAAVAAIVVAFVAIVTTSGFDVFTAPWIMIGKSMVNIGFIAGVVSLGKDLLSTNRGSLLNIGPSA